MKLRHTGFMHTGNILAGGCKDCCDHIGSINVVTDHPGLAGAQHTEMVTIGHLLRRHLEYA